MNTTDYIIPTKESPVFVAVCSYFGYLYRGMYKMNKVRNSVCDTWAVNYMDAVNELHEAIKANPHWVNENPDCNFTIYAMDGSWEDRHDQAKLVKVYEISAKKAKKYIL